MEIPIQILITELSKVFHLLPELYSLRLHLLSNLETKEISRDDFLLLFSLIKNRIRKLYINNICVIEEIFLFIDLFQHINHLQVNVIYPTNVKSCVRDILIYIREKSNHPLRILCIDTPMIDDDILHGIKEMIHNEKLLSNFTVKRVMDKIYLQWK